MVITSALHAEGRQFDPGRNHKNFANLGFHVSVAILKYCSIQIKILGHKYYHQDNELKMKKKKMKYYVSRPIFFLGKILNFCP